MAGQGYVPVRLPSHCNPQHQSRRQPRHSADILTTRQVANEDSVDHLSSAPIPNSPPPSFKSNDSSPRTSHQAHGHRRTPSRPQDDLADAFDGPGSDTEDENDGDDRQRLMRGTPSATAASGSATPGNGEAQADGAIQLTDTPQVARPVGQAPVQGRVYGGGSGDGVFANLSAKPERGEKLIEEFPPVSIPSLPTHPFSPLLDSSQALECLMLTQLADIRSRRRRRRSPLLGNHHPHSRQLRPQRSLHRRSPRRLLLLIHMERHDLHVLPTRRLPFNLPPPYHSRREKWE